MSQSNEAGLTYTLSVAITALSVSFYVLSSCVPDLSCCDVMKDFETSRLDGKRPSQDLVAYERPVFFQVGLSQ